MEELDIDLLNSMLGKRVRHKIPNTATTYEGIVKNWTIKRADGLEPSTHIEIEGVFKQIKVEEIELCQGEL